MTESTPRAADEKYCASCAAAIKARAEICPRCGVRQMAPPNNLFATAPNGKSKLVAGLFGLFLGGFGIHKFYLGRIGQGILYLLFCWTFLPMVVGFIEGVVYLAMSDADFNRHYGGDPVSGGPSGVAAMSG